MSTPLTASTADAIAFSEHDLAFALFDVREVSITYAQANWRLFEQRLAPPKAAADARRYPNAKVGAYHAFEGPLALRWRARDGAQLETVIDLDQVFPERKIVHGEAGRIYRPQPLAGLPTIIVELNDRSVALTLFATLQLAASDGGPVRETRSLRSPALCLSL